ncbi:Ribonuclease, Rne/Rng family [Desulfosarcina cetonica]|uniref:Rne/Rng family ribonuclease n=1 Tax=Desulfosarcina cetonica TaxID=90730 RepID=UPI0006D290AD|nr:Rne/Rng family ribonuclease [Desulfosarcina cetonica]VTR68209.1 Ribonuclease, Rne/Rng family [Desulfosarcina cetonica]
MTSKILINAVDPEEVRLAIVKESRLEEFHIESSTREILHSSIYKGVITRIEPSLQAVFVDFGADRHGFLQKQEIHSDYFQDPPSAGNSIQNLVRRGQELVVQVTKDPIMKKGAMLTTFISLPGRYAVLMPGSNSRGISRKIEDEDERKRLKEIVEKLNLPEGFGIIIRTAGMGITKTLLAKDVQYLLRLWNSITELAVNAQAPSALYKDRNLAVRSIRDHFNPDVKEILIDDEAVYQEVKNFVKIISPKQIGIVKLHKSGKPIFTRFQLEDQIATIFNNRVTLKSGGSVVLERTEALVAIDVNSGKGTQKKNIEETALMTNLEAAAEIARQLRIRDLGGLIVIDFIDMREQKHRNQVEKVLRAAMKEDRARVKIGKISKFGLLELSRQRLRPSIDFGSMQTCPHCGGKGQVPSAESLGLSFLRKLKLDTLKEDIRQVTARLPAPVANYLLNRKRRELLELETKRAVVITIIAQEDLIPGQMEVTIDKKSKCTENPPVAEETA